MKSIFGKRILPVFLTFVILMGSMVYVANAEAVTNPILSYGLTVLSARTDVALATFAGNDYVFSEDALARGLNLSSVNYITVLSVPPVTDGELLLGSSRVVSGQSIFSEQFDNLNFHPSADEILHTSFTFSANGSGTPMACNLYFLTNGNAIPTVNTVPTLSLSVSTYRDLCAYGTLSAYEPDGDDFRFEIVSYPKNGSLQLTDPVSGSYIYTPDKGYTGKDSFRYVARDCYGNYSTPATVSLKVAVSGTSVSYADMENSPANAAALMLTENGIMSGKQVGNRYYFYPEENVGRAEFLVMAMNAAGIKEVPDCKQTVFADDAGIPQAMKGYVAAAYELGYVTGEQSGDALYFHPNDPLTKADAAVILGKLLDLKGTDAVQTFADEDSIPVVAKDALIELHSIGIMSAEAGYLHAESQVNRADAALILSAMISYL